ncbi:MAG: 5'-nucleotidase C-terminal domain-containing protein [Spirochaetales bacterium]|nr:5'-nucleotidase C-terminal domain-containing protein [Spirochaetales bacterium]
MKKVLRITGFLFLAFALLGCASQQMVQTTDAKAVSYPLSGFTPVEREATMAPDGGAVEINLFTTNDEHGWVFDWDFGQGQPRSYKGNPVPSGLSRVSTLYKEKAAMYDNPVLISSGDTIQGTLLSYYYNFIESDKENPMSRMMGKMGYSYWAPGNHEVEQGNAVANKVANEMAAQGIAVISANTEWKGTGEPYYLPYAVEEIDGVRIGYLGMTTPGIPMWLAESTHEDQVYKDMVDTAEKYVAILREVEKVDVLVGVFHAGMNDAYDSAKAASSGVPIPNASRLVAAAVGAGPQGFDAIITAHSHKLIDDTQNTEYRNGEYTNEINGVKFVQAQNWGSHLGHLQISVAAKEGRWMVDDVKAMTYSMEGVEEDPEMLNYMAEYIEGSKAYASKVVAQADNDILGLRSYYEESEIVDLIHETQRHFSGAEISIAATFNASLKIPKGDITVGNIAGIYIYENFLNALEMTGQQIKDYLEYSSSYFNVITEETVDSVPLVNPDVRGYNYDMAQGFYYEIDLTKEPGDRIVNMKNLDGSAFDLGKTYNVTLNSYRYNGGGGHLAAAGLMEGTELNAETTYISQLAMRDLMVEYLQEKKSWGESDIESNWKLVPEDLAARAIENQLNAGNSAR